MDLSTEYLGWKLSHPFVAGASPLADTLDSVRRVEDAGAAAIVMRSLFEEQINAESLATHHATEAHAESFGEALSYLPDPEDFRLGPDAYLEHLRRIKQVVGIPVMASLNGTTLGGWLDHARLLEQAGADGLELNLYDVVTDFETSSADVEARYVEIVRDVRAAVGIPLAVKLSQQFTSLPHFARQLDQAGANGLVLFNRFFEPDIDPEALEVVSHLRLSSSSELLLRLRWLAILSGQLRCSLAVSGGVHTAVDAVKAVMSGADVIQVVSRLLREGPAALGALRRELANWLEDHEYTSLAQMRGSMNRLHSPNPESFERGNYMHILQTWSGNGDARVT